MPDTRLERRLRRKQWPADRLKHEACESGPRRIDSFVIVPRALRHHDGSKPRVVKRQAVVQASIKTYLLPKREYAKEELDQDQDEKEISTKRICCRQECIIIDVENFVDLRCRTPSDVETSSLVLESISKHQMDAGHEDSKFDQDGLDENPEPDSEPDTQAKCLSPPSPPHVATQPDSEPETECVASANGLQESSGTCIRQAPLAHVVEHHCVGFTDPPEDALGFSAYSEDDANHALLHSPLINAVSEFRAFDETSSALSEKILHSAHLNDATTASRELKSLEQHFVNKCLSDNDVMMDSSPDNVLKHARQAGYVVGQALCRVANGACASSSQHLGSSLVEELSEFAKFAASISFMPSTRKEKCVSNGNGLGLNTLRGRTLQALGNVAILSDEVWGYFGGIEGYATHLQKSDSVHNVGLAVSGNAVWQRLTSELQAAIMLAEPRQPGVYSNDSSWVFDQLHCRLCYMAARVAWALECQARDALAWMRDVSFSSEAQDTSSEMPSFASCHRRLQLCPVIRDLLHAALRDAAAKAALHFLETLDRALQASCQTKLLVETQPGSDVVQRTVAIIKEHLVVEVAACCKASLVEFRDKWLHGEIEGMGLGRRHREVVDRRHQTLRRVAARSTSALQTLQKLDAEMRTRTDQTIR